MAYRASIRDLPSWALLAHLRKRGQRPAGFMLVTDHERQRRNLIASGAFALPLPKAEEGYLVAGLEVALFADRNEPGAEAAGILFASHPASLVVLWRGGEVEAL